MRYPIDDQMFNEVVQTRRAMEEKNPDPDRIGIAGPFLPWIGEEILDSKPGIYIIGIATFGPYGAGRKAWTLEEIRQESGEVLQDESIRRRPFWRFVNRLAEAVYRKSFFECAEKLAWSNQYKIGLFSKAGKSDVNPEKCKELREMQFELCKKILQCELQFAEKCAIVFLGDGSLIYPTVGGKDAWDTERHRELGIWVLKNADNRLPVFYDYHPNYLFRRHGALVAQHVEVIAGVGLQKRLKHQPDEPQRQAILVCEHRAHFSRRTRENLRQRIFHPEGFS
jgi:uracil-DNA glycosylase